MSFKRRLSALLAFVMVLSLFTAFPSMGVSAADILESSVYYVDHTNGVVYDVVEGTSVAGLKNNFENSESELIVCDANGNTVANGVVCTGYTVETDDEVASIVVKGDNNSDGAISSIDALALDSHVAGSMTLEGADVLASDMDYDGVVTSTDYLMICSHLSGASDINKTKHPQTPDDEDSSSEEESSVLETYTVTFTAGNGGFLSGTTEFTVDEGTSFSEISVPSVSCKDGYIFTGWSASFPETVTEDLSFVAEFEASGISTEEKNYASAEMGGKYMFTVGAPFGTYSDSFAAESDYGIGYLNDGVMLSNTDDRWVEASREDYQIVIKVKLSQPITMTKAVLNCGLQYFSNNRVLPDKVSIYTATEDGEDMYFGETSAYTALGDYGYIATVEGSAEDVVYVKYVCPMSAFIGRFGEVEVYGFGSNAPSSYNVNFVAGDNGTLSGTTEYNLPAGTLWNTVTVPTPVANEGYKFVGWTPSLPENSSAVHEDVTYTANFDYDDSQYVTVDFVAGANGTVNGTTSFKVLKGTAWSEIAVPTVTADAGYKFDSWSPSFPETVEGDSAYTANFVYDETQYAEINFTAGSNGSLSGVTTVTALIGSDFGDITLPVTVADTGYKFGSWSPALPKTVEGDATYVAEFVIDESQYAVVTFESGANGSIEGTASYTVLKGTPWNEITVPNVVADVGYKFVTWSPSFPETITESATYTATFAIDNELYATVLFVAGANGSLSGTASYTVLKGTAWSDIDVPEAVANAGYKFGSWSPSFPETIEEDATYTASFEYDASQYATIIFDAGDNGELVGDTVFSVLIGSRFSDIEIPEAVAYAGYKFDGWSPALPQTVMEDAVYTAVFAYDETQYATVTFVAGANGTISGTTSFTVLKGTDWSAITVPTATAKAGYKFSAWSPSFPSTVEADTTYTANFVYDATQFATVSFAAGTNGSLSGTTSVTVLKGTAWSVITVPTPVANAGFKFNAWSPSFPETITENVAFTASFVYDATQYATVSFLADENGSLSGASSFTVLKGTAWASISVPSPVANDGYRFASWDVAFPATVTEDVSFTAQFELIPTHSIVFVSGSNGSISGTWYFDDVEEGAIWGNVITVPTPVPDAGYVFSEWSPALPSADSEINADATYTALFVVEESGTHRDNYASSANGGTYTYFVGSFLDGSTYNDPNFSTVSTESIRSGFSSKSYNIGNGELNNDTEVYLSDGNWVEVARGSTSGFNGQSNVVMMIVKLSEAKSDISQIVVNLGTHATATNRGLPDKVTVEYTTKTSLSSSNLNWTSIGSTASYEHISGYGYRAIIDSSVTRSIKYLRITLSMSTYYAARLGEIAVYGPEVNTTMHTVNFVAGANGSLSGTTSFTVVDGTSWGSITVPTPVAKDGYRFSHWSPELPLSSATINASATYTAVFTEKLGGEELNYALSTNGGQYMITSGTVQSGYPDSFDSGSAYGSGYLNDGEWLTDTDDNWVEVSRSNGQICVTYKLSTPITMTSAVINFGLREWSSNRALPDSVAVYVGSSITDMSTLFGSSSNFVATSDYGYKLTVNGTAEDVQYVYFVATMSQYIGRLGEFEIIGAEGEVVPTYTVSFNSGANGTISGSTLQTVVEGTKWSEITVPTATANAGYTFSGWTPSLPSSTDEITENLSFKANFTYDASQWSTLTFTAGEGGTLSGTTVVSVVTGSAWSAVTVPTVVENEGYTFTGWSPNFPSTVTGSATFTANFIVTPVDQYVVSFTAGVGGKLSGTTTFTVDEGTAWSEITVPTPVADSGYVFASWTPVLPTSEDTVSANASYVANFIPDIGQDLEGIIYISGVNANQFVSGGSHIYTVNYGSAFTATYWEVYVAGYSEAKGGYIVTEKYAVGSTKSVDVPMNGIVVAVHMGSENQAACAYVDVGDLLILTDDINLDSATCVSGTSYISVYAGDGTEPDGSGNTDTPDDPVDPSVYQQLNYSNVKGMWLSQFDLSSVYTSSSSQRSEASFRTLMTTILDNCVSNHINTIYLQVRPNGDSMYPSEYYTPSKYVVGSYGKTFNYDPFAIVIEMCHERNLSVQAWINPLRLMTSSDITSVSTSYKVGEWYKSSSYNGKYVVLYNGYYYLNPAYEEVRQLIIDGAAEICTLYNVDGVHMDDYFYPTTDSSFDSTAYNAYTGSLSLANWRRQNLNLLVSGLYSAIKAVDEDIVFGISPAGNMSTVYNSQYADVYTWCSTSGYIDYICPQVYFGMLHSSQGFGSCSTGWSNIITSSDVTLYVGITLSKALNGYNGTIDTYAGTTEGQYEWINNRDVIKSCLEYARDSLPKCTGVVFFCYQYFYSPTTGASVAGTAEERANFLPVLEAMYPDTSLMATLEE